MTLKTCRLIFTVMTKTLIEVKASDCQMFSCQSMQIVWTFVNSKSVNSVSG